MTGPPHTNSNPEAVLQSQVGSESLERPFYAGSPLRVAVLVFDDVEVLDFAGPFEVFGVARDTHNRFCFEVFSVALSSGIIVARNGLRIEPHCAAADMGRVDVFIVPGGYGSRREMRRSEMLEFVCQTSRSAAVTLSVCTGSLILGAAGLLHGLAATTHFGALDELRALDCRMVLPHARVVDNGRVLTSAGISAGIDASLHLVSRLVGSSAAVETARYMQYDWVQRTVDYQTEEIT